MRTSDTIQRPPVGRSSTLRSSTTSLVQTPGISRKPSMPALQTERSQSSGSTNATASKTTVSYLPATVTTRSPRYRQTQAAQQPESKKIFYANEVSTPRSSSPLATQPTIRPGLPLRSSTSSSRASSSKATTNAVKSRPAVSNSSPTAYQTLMSANANARHSAPVVPSLHSKFVYANGDEEVMSPRRPAPSASVASSSTSALSPPPFFHLSPTLSASSFSSAMSSDEVDSQYSAAEESGDDDDTANKVPEEDSARVNRKILDLEISNTSLLEINRTLERQMRSQSRELRALKRWIQRNNISGDEFNTADMSVSDTEDSEGEGVKDDHGSLNEEEDNTLHAVHEASKASKKWSMPMDKFTITEEELLATSRAMNNSITKCIFMSDLMVKEAKTSLSYTVLEDELRVGGRVLSYDDATQIYMDDGEIGADEGNTDDGDDNSDDDDVEEEDEDGDDKTIMLPSNTDAS
ncbi:hypothetical protein V1512DRAFT_17157 [Lipomyces arxii]|uniref:uncharacterized protein n=1 Tax=Lipomyces arxii TaxID=56418 RepID=UPI0034CEB82A